MERGNKKYSLILKIIFTLALLVCLLYLFESGSGSGIDSFANALWYALVTLTTVGYGDMTPVTLPGRIIGVILMLCSLGILSLILTTVLSWLNKGLPLWRLKRCAEKEWNILIGDSAETEALFRNLSAAAEKDEVFIFLKEAPEFDIFCEPEDNMMVFRVNSSLEKLLKYRRTASGVNVFYFGEDHWDNYTAARESALSSQASFYAMTEVKDNFSVPNLSLFNKQDEIARSYWDTYPIHSKNEKILICGFGSLRDAILSRALLTNILSPDQSISYLCAEDLEDFADYHYRLFEKCEKQPESSAVSYQMKAEPFDLVTVWSSLWKIPADRIQSADRIILCADSGEENMMLFQRLQSGYACSAEIHLFSPELNTVQGAEAFGSYRTIFSKEAVLKQERISLARKLNDSYRLSVGGNAPTWEELSEFHKQSNISSADHLNVKCKILLGDDKFSELRTADQDILYREALKAYREQVKDPRKLDLFRWIEHDRWMRFHLFNNWGYDPVRCNQKHLHNLCVPYSELSPEEQRKDDAAWTILEAIQGL